MSRCCSFVHPSSNFSSFTQMFNYCTHQIHHPLSQNTCVIQTLSCLPKLMYHLHTWIWTKGLWFELLSIQPSFSGIEEDLARVGPVLQRYTEMNSRPCVSFAQDSSGPLPVRTFLCQLEWVNGELRVIKQPDTDWTQLGIYFIVHCFYTSFKCHKCLHFV